MQKALGFALTAERQLDCSLSAATSRPCASTLEIERVSLCVFDGRHFGLDAAYVFTHLYNTLPYVEADRSGSNQKK